MPEPESMATGAAAGRPSGRPRPSVLLWPQLPPTPPRRDDGSRWLWEGPRACAACPQWVACRPCPRARGVPSAPTPALFPRPSELAALGSVTRARAGHGTCFCSLLATRPAQLLAPAECPLGQDRQGRQGRSGAPRGKNHVSLEAGSRLSQEAGGRAPLLSPGRASAQSVPRGSREPRAVLAPRGP